MDRPLENRAAIVTGANRGLGLEIARKYAAAGASLVLCARGADALEQARSEVSAFAGPGQKIVTQIADVSDPADVGEVVALAETALGGVDILVNNAGIYGPKGDSEESDGKKRLKPPKREADGQLISKCFLNCYKPQRRLSQPNDYSRPHQCGKKTDTGAIFFRQKIADTADS